MNSPRLIKNLQAELCGHVGSSLDVDGHSVRAALARVVRHVKMTVLLLVGERAVGLDSVRPRKAAACVGHGQEGLVGRRDDSVGKLDA